MRIPNLTCLAELLPASPLSPAAAPAWQHTLYPFWIVNLLATAFVSIVLLRRVLSAPVRTDLEDAARIDGCGFWRLCWHAMLPLLRPAIGFLGIFIFIVAADDAMAPLIEAGQGTPSPGLYALHLSAPGIRVGPGSLGLLMAASLLLAPAVIALLFLARRYFRKAEAPPD